MHVDDIRVDFGISMNKYTKSSNLTFSRKAYEPLYIATDEKFRPWFDDFKNQHSGPLRYLSDYKDLIGLDNLDVTIYGLVDTLVASRGAMFAGTWFSSFSGYIVRLRGYYGMSKFSTYYSWLDRKYFMHKWANPWEASYFAREVSMPSFIVFSVIIRIDLTTDEIILLPLSILRDGL